MKWWREGERLVYRSRFEALWLGLPRVLVLAALPGWGKRTFMHQCADFLRQQQPLTQVVWTTAVADLGQAADEAQITDSEVLLCIDARYCPASFWDELRAALDSRPWARAIVACYDPPPPPADPESSVGGLAAGLSGEAEGPSWLTLYEADLAFDEAELWGIATLLGESGAVIDNLTRGRERGYAALTGLHIERLLARGREGAWIQTIPPIEAEVFALINRGAVSNAVRHSDIGRVLRDVRELPAFSAELIRDAAGGLRGAEIVLARLAAVPLFEIDADEAGRRQCLWTAAAWEYLRSTERPDQTRDRLQRGLARYRDAGLLVPQLRLLLELGDLNAAEQLVADRYRQILLLCDSGTAALLREDPQIDPTRSPMLTMLRNQFVVRRTGLRQALRIENGEVVARLRQIRSDGLLSEVSRSSKIAYAATYAGNRGVASRYLGHLMELLESVNGSEPPGLSGVDRLVLLDSCFLGWWAALQIDRLDDALRLAEAMERWGDEADSLHMVEAQCIEAVQDVAGLRSLASDGTVPPSDPFNEARGLLDLEVGDDRKALRSVERLLGAVGAQQSATDALTVLILAVAGGQARAAHVAQAAMRDSVEHWDDDVPSTHLTWAAITASSLIGAKQEAKDWLARIDNEQDVFAVLARMTFALWDGTPRRALEALPSTGWGGLPRMVVCVKVLEAAAHAELGDADRARLSLEQAWKHAPAPRLLRFALRLIPRSVFGVLLGLSGDVQESIQEILELAASDRRTLSWSSRPRITPSEREILQMLARGMSNAAIADARFITLGTLRTHLKSLYKKLDVSSRSEAVTIAGRLDLIEV